MKRHRTLWRRPLAVLGAAVIGLTGVVALGAPASAHHTAVQGEASCVDGSYQVRWTVRSESTPPAATSFRFVAVDTAPAGTAVGAITPSPENEFPHPVGEPVIGVQTVPDDATEARLAVRAQWNNGHTEDQAGEGVVALAGTCGTKDQPGGPTASFTSICASAIDVRLTNPAKAPAVELLLASIPAGGAAQTVPLAPGEKKDVRFPVEGWDGVSVTVAGSTEPLATYLWTDPGNCALANVTTRSTCDTFTLFFADPPNGDTWTVTFSPTYGKARKRVVKPGQTIEETFDGREGQAVVAEYDYWDPDGDYFGPWEWEQPADCGGGGAGGGALPLTGASTGGLASGAALLLLAGAGLFLVARRRRLRFTA
ncbi:LPXTG cell wall anchor domain-containing protein [Micromonospora sp. NPDC048909]|uniref:LPXTG cell wall anchor domain-containing protein n=1 Tax=Micromonospora sp. NPDC048909 TaxID=3155643 RepID=UPI0033C6C8DB